MSSARLNNRTATRKKFLKLLTRAQLEQLSERAQPWHMNRPELENEVALRWPKDEIEEQVRYALSECGK